MAACQPTTEPEVTGSAVLLEIEYINYAWTPQFFGFYIDGAGDVYSYNRDGAPWTPGEDQKITEEELTEKFSPNRTLVTTRDSAEVGAVAARVRQVSELQLSAERFLCADAGLLTYRAYRYNAASRTYRPILLRTEGDRARENSSQPARDLIQYIRSLDLLEELLGCDP